MILSSNYYKKIKIRALNLEGLHFPNNNIPKEIFLLTSLEALTLGASSRKKSLASQAPHALTARF
ncbi:MAG: hypothetical protein BGO77_00225 [Caedibacter sp. 37-49]|nr:MAG: hypothetical protein BGO77_00225 [Caedibacter sp. 37-49]